MNLPFIIPNAKQSLIPGAITGDIVGSVFEWNNIKTIQNMGNKMRRTKHYLKFSFWLAMSIIATGTGYAQSEAVFNRAIAKELHGQVEQRVPGGGVADIITEEYAIEVDFGPEWKESIGQSLWYAQQTNKKPGIVLIFIKPNDRKYGIMLQSTLNYAGLKDRVRVWFWPEDFGGTAAVNHLKTEITSLSNSYWLSTNSHIRHNANCRWYRRSKGKACSKYEGKPCSLCGG